MSLDSLRGVVGDLIKRFGRPVVIRRVSRGDYDPATGAVSEEADERPIRVLTSAYPRDGRRGESRGEDGVRAGDLKLVCAASDVEPDVPDRTTQWLIGDDAWTTVKVDSQIATEQVVYYTCQLRK